MINSSDYQWVHLKKDINHQKNLYGGQVSDPELIAEIMRGYDRVKDNYVETLCKNCGTTRPQMSWTKLSTEALGKAADSMLSELYHSCYFVPTMQTHSTMGAIFARLKPLGEMNTRFSSEPQRDEATGVTRNAHFIMLSVLHTQDQHFELGMEDELMQRAKELDNAWVNEDSSVKSAPESD